MNFIQNIGSILNFNHQKVKFMHNKLWYLLFSLFLYTLSEHPIRKKRF